MDQNALAQCMSVNQPVAEGFSAWLRRTGLAIMPGYKEYIKAHGQIIGIQDIRDRNTAVRLVVGYLKLLFPDMNLSHTELVEYCLRPATSLR